MDPRLTILLDILLRYSLPLHRDTVIPVDYHAYLSLIRRKYFFGGYPDGLQTALKAVKAEVEADEHCEYRLAHMLFPFDDQIMYRR